CQQYDTDPRTF
nr:immunoglobulin light chain junction region [Macaca mulatta]MOV85643.1 immunoglobulin light chain junction region [Macaca mulatta]